jgi:hypothetical protein
MKLVITFLILLLTSPAWAIDATLQWDAPDDARVTGYNVYYGTTALPSDNKTAVTDTQLKITGLTEGVTYFFGVTSTAGDAESVMSDVLEWKAEQSSKVIYVPGKPKSIRLIFE